MKKQVRVLVALALCFGYCSIYGQDSQETLVDSEFQKPEYRSDQFYYRSFASAKSNDKDKAKSIALHNAKLEMAAQIEVNLKSSFKSFSGQENNSLQASEITSTINTILSSSVCGIKIINSELVNNGDGSYTVNVVIETDKSIVDFECNSVLRNRQLHKRTESNSKDLQEQSYPVRDSNSKSIESLSVKGVSVSRDLTPKQALSEAIKNAKMKALQKASVSESIESMSVLVEQESTGSDLIQHLSEISKIESNADVVIDSVYPETRTFDSNNNMIVEVDVDVTVYKYSQRKDDSFYALIEGVKEVYYKDEVMNFDFVPSKDGYLKIFSVNDATAFLLYPYYFSDNPAISDNNNRLFLQGEKVSFPVNMAFKPGYVFDFDTDALDEVNHLIFVYSKENIAWIENDVSFNNIYKWIAKISPDKRTVIVKTFILKR